MAGGREGLPGGDEGVALAIVEVAVALVVNVALAGETADLGGEVGGEPRGVEAVDGAGTAAPGEEAVVVTPTPRPSP